MPARRRRVRMRRSLVRARPGDAADAQVPRRRRRRLHVSRREAVVRATQLPPPDVLRIPALLRRDVVATIYHYVFGWKAPYPFWSLPVLLGTLGGLGLLAGPVGPVVARAPARSGARRSAQTGMDVGFLVLLFLDQPHRAAAARVPRDARDGRAARAAPRRRAGALPHAALRQVRARALPLRRAGALPHRAPAPAAGARPGDSTSADQCVCESSR